MTKETFHESGYASSAGGDEQSVSVSPPAPLKEQPSSMMEWIDLWVRDPSVDVEKFERIMAMRERTEAHEAELGV
jgi:hypothetical protein